MKKHKRTIYFETIERIYEEVETEFGRNRKVYCETKCEYKIKQNNVKANYKEKQLHKNKARTRSKQNRNIAKNTYPMQADKDYSRYFYLREIAEFLCQILTFLFVAVLAQNFEDLAISIIGSLFLCSMQRLVQILLQGNQLG